jgi:hypothetical protein
LELNQVKINRNGQVLVEAIAALLILISLLVGFFTYLYRSSLLTLSEYHLNQALNCEHSTILQDKKFIDSKRGKVNFAEENSEKNYQTKIHDSRVPHRKNKNCLAKAKADIQKITPWSKIEIRRNKTTDNYEVKAKWARTSILKVEATTALKKTKVINSQTRALPFRPYSSSSL